MKTNCAGPDTNRPATHMYSQAWPGDRAYIVRMVQHSRVFAMDRIQESPRADLHASGSSSQSGTEAPPADRSEVVPLAVLVAVFLFDRVV